MCGSRGNSSVGRARPCQGRGREFESRFPLQILRRNLGQPGFCFLRDRKFAPRLSAVGDRMRLPGDLRSASRSCQNRFTDGQVAEWSCSGLQSRVRRFDSDPGLHPIASRTCEMTARTGRDWLRTMKVGLPAIDALEHWVALRLDAQRSSRRRQSRHEDRPRAAAGAEQDSGRAAALPSRVAPRRFDARARVAKSVDARDLKSLDPKGSCRFESGPGHQ